MVRLLVFMVLLAGCVSEPMPLPDWNELEPIKTEIQQPIVLPELPIPSSDGDKVVFTKDQFQVLTRYITISGGNFTIATANADALKAMETAYKYLIDAGKLQRQIAEIRAELLEIERRDHFVDVWFHRGIIVLIGFVAL